MNTGYKNMYVLDKLRQRSLLNRSNVAKMEKRDGCAGRLIYYCSQQQQGE